MNFKKWSRILIFVALLWLLIAGMLTLMLWPDLPHTPIQWFLFVGFGPPVYILGETFFGWLCSRNHGQALSPRRFSTLRICVALPAMLVVFALCWGLTWLLSNP